MSRFSPLITRRAASFVALLVALAVLSPWHTSVVAQSQTVVALVNARNPSRSISKAEAKKMFLAQTAFWHGVVPVKLVLRPDASPVAQAFYTSVVGYSPASYRKHWDELQLAGRNVAPPQGVTIADVVRLVAAAPGGLSFAFASELQGATLTGVKSIPLQ